MIDPLFDGIDRRRHEHRVTADELQILNRPILLIYACNRTVPWILACRASGG
jgi:hypothetical protein